MPDGSVPMVEACTMLQTGLRRLQEIEREKLHLEIQVAQQRVRTLRVEAAWSHALLLGRLYVSHLVPAEFAPFHVEALEEMWKNPKVAAAAPRYHGKSTVITILRSLWLTVTRLTRYILILASSDRMAENFLGKMRWEIETNESLRRDLGVSQGDKWGQEESRVVFVDAALPERLRPAKQSFPVKWIGRGWGSAIRGEHPDDLVAEDLEDEIDMESEKIRQSLSVWWKRTVGGMTGPETRAVLVGTIVNPLSLMNDMVTNPPSGWRAVNYTALYRRGKELLALWPNFRPVEWLLSKLAELGLVAFGAEYLGFADFGDDKPYKAQHIAYYEDLPEILHVTACLDPSSGDVTPWAFTIRAVDPSGDWWLLDCESDRTDPLDMMKRFVDSLVFWDPMYVGVEQVAGARLLAYTLPEAFREKGVSFDLHKVGGGGSRLAKITRIKQILSPVILARRLHIRREQVSVKDAILRFPDLPVDILDSLAMHGDLPAYVPPERPPEPEIFGGVRFGDVLKQIQRRNHPNKFLTGYR